MEILRLENLSKYYTTQNAVVMGLTGISLSFEVGEFVAVTGESGSGKSTLAHVLSGIIPYESGELYVHGKPTSHFDSADWERYRRDMIGFISQSYGILAGNTVLDNVVSTLRLYGIEPDAAKERALEILREVELSEFAERKAGKLSSGQKQRLSIARALAKPSKILIADEPTGNLDRENSEKVVELLKRASRDRLVIIITHEFSEVENLATRRIILADGSLMTDARLRECAPKGEENPQARAASGSTKGLSRYVTALTLKSHPVLSSIVCLLIAAVTFITFVLLGTFTIALDETPAKIYSSEAFFNGDSRRIVLMKTDGTDLTEEDYEKILSVKRTESIERFGYIADINYYYREGDDYRIDRVIVNGPNYHSYFNPNDFHIIESPVFLENDSYMRTIPVTYGGTGETIDGIYSVISSDPSHNVGDRITVYFKNRKEWATSFYMCMRFEVVGKTDNTEEGLYFSDRFASMMNETMDFAQELDNIPAGSNPMLLVPFDKDAIELTAYLSKKDGKVIECTEGEFVDYELGYNDFLLPTFNTDSKKDIGNPLFFRDTNGKNHVLSCKGCAKSNYPLMVIVSEERFNEYVDGAATNQISLYISDYSYTDRVLDELAELGYFAMSPFRLGATETDPELEADRLNTLLICAGAFMLVFVLSIILMRAIFSSLYGYFGLMSNIGLVSRVAYPSLLITLTLFTAIGEALGAFAVMLLNSLGVLRVANIFKYLEAPTIILLFVINTACIVVAMLGVVLGFRKAIFKKSVVKYDIDFREMEV